MIVSFLVSRNDWNDKEISPDRVVVKNDFKSTSIVRRSKFVHYLTKRIYHTLVSK